MKKQNKQRIKAHLLRGGFYLLVALAGTLVFFFRLEARVNLSHRTLTFAERVAYQRTIEDVYWRHRIWPKENRNPKPPLDAVMSQARVQAKVTDYLRKSQALEDYWQRPITAEQLQAEMDRMAKHTKKPEVLRELFESLGNDPFVIAECLVRPLLAERLFQSKLQGSPKTNEETIQSGSRHNADVTTLISYALPVTNISSHWTPAEDIIQSPIVGQLPVSPMCLLRE
jgi:hypothetical protein